MSLKLLVNTPDIHEAFLAYIKERIAVSQQTLESASDPKDLYRVQGEIKAYRRMLKIRDEVNMR
jgi:hypothetical protein